jgi:hypothetical protein
MAAPDISLIISQYGAYYRSNGPIGRNNLHRHIFDRTDTKALFNIRQTDNTVIDEVNISLTEVLQPFYAKFSPKGQLTFTPNPWQLGHVKIEEEIAPDKFAATALDWLNTKTPDRMDAPLLSLISEYYIQKAKEDDEDKVVFKGSFALPSAPNQALGVAGASVDSRDGIRKVIRGYNTAGQLIDEDGNSNVLVLGSVPTTPAAAVQYLEAFYYGIPEKFRKNIKFIACKKSLAELFARGMQDKNGYYDRTKGQNLTIMDTDCQIVGLHSMIGSNMCWASPKENNIGFVKNGGNGEIVKLWQSGIYTVQMSTDWWEGYNFISPQLIYTNDQDLA